MYFEIGCAIILLVYLFDRQLIRVQWNSLASFIAFLLVFVVAQIAIGSYTFNGFVPSNPLKDIESWRLALVFWEDAFYVIPMYYAFKIDKTKYQIPSILFAVVMSLWFGSGHLYQGIMGAVVTSFYPYFISLRYARKVGFGTVMLAHILYDFAILFLVRYGHYMY
jgi:hypothetical protein